MCCCMQVSQLVRKMLDATQLQKHALNLKLSRVHLPQLLAHLLAVPWESRCARTPTASIVSASSQDSGPGSDAGFGHSARLRLDLGPDLPCVCADSDRLLQVCAPPVIPRLFPDAFSDVFHCHCLGDWIVIVFGSKLSVHLPPAVVPAGILLDCTLRTSVIQHDSTLGVYCVKSDARPKVQIHHT